MSDYVGTLAELDFVRNQLSMYAGLKKEGSNGTTFILCPFHAEKTPSGRVFHSDASKAPGWFKCYGCGESRSWSDLAPHIGLKPYKQQKPSVEFANFSLLPDGYVEEEVGDFIEEKMKCFDLPPNKVWREIPTNLLIELGARLCEIKHPEHGWLKRKLWLPVYINKELRGYIKARLKKHPDYPSYINARGSWSKTHGLFPYDYAIRLMKRLKSKTIVLVEGQRDALRLLSMGIPAVCILGTQSWSDTKAKLLELGGVERIIILMDGDCAGIQATEMLVDKNKLFEVKVIKLWSIKGSPYIQFRNKKNPSKAAKKAGVSLWDPGNCPEWILKKIKRIYF